MAELYVSLKYGNLTQEQHALATSKSLYDGVVAQPKWSKGSYPQADSVEMLDELNTVSQYMSRVSESDLRYSRRIDENLELFYCQELDAKRHKGLAVQIQRIMSAVAPVVMKVKAKNQRPRPYQVAMYIDVSLRPYKTFSGHSPSWPSGHSCQARMLTLCLGEMYPDLQNKLSELENMVHNSRLCLGIHYPSDLQAGADLADEMFDNEDITDKLLQGVAGYI
jgi:hypothetical protein